VVGRGQSCTEQDLVSMCSRTTVDFCTRNSSREGTILQCVVMVLDPFVREQFWPLMSNALSETLQNLRYNFTVGSLTRWDKLSVHHPLHRIICCFLSGSYSYKLFRTATITLNLFHSFKMCSLEMIHYCNNLIC
jgi:hypothetical protein